MGRDFYRDRDFARISQSSLHLTSLLTASIVFLIIILEMHNLNEKLDTIVLQ